MRHRIELEVRDMTLEGSKQIITPPPPLLIFNRMSQVTEIARLKTNQYH